MEVDRTYFAVTNSGHIMHSEVIFFYPPPSTRTTNSALQTLNSMLAFLHSVHVRAVDAN